MVRYLNINFKPGELTGGGPRSSPAALSVFVAYRFQASKSISFRSDLEQRLSSIESLRDVVVVDGKQILLGEKWSGRIRDVLSKSKLIVAELTSLSPEVLFECGYAFGLRKPILPVVEDPSWHSRLPRWITTLQIGTFENENGWKEIIDTIDKIINKIITIKYQRKFEPDPGAAIWIPGNDWYENKKEFLSSTANRFDMNIPVIISPEDVTNNSDYVLNEVAKSSLVIASVDNTDIDSLVHFACGMVVSKAKSGVAKRKMTRKVILVTNENTKLENIIADSARRASHVIKIVKPHQFNNAIIRFGELYRKWRQDCEKLS
jgi:nucleoside 2-deoxyribosyltransferase